MKRSINHYSQFLLRLHSISDDNPDLTLTNGLKWQTVVGRLPHLNKLYDSRDRLKDDALETFSDDVVVEKLILPFVKQIKAMIPEDQQQLVLNRLGVQ